MFIFSIFPHATNQLEQQRNQQQPPQQQLQPQQPLLQNHQQQALQQPLQHVSDGYYNVSCECCLDIAHEWL